LKAGTIAFGDGMTAPSLPHYLAQEKRIGIAFD
jgi:hypothetical protein